MYTVSLATLISFTIALLHLIFFVSHINNNNPQNLGIQPHKRCKKDWPKTTKDVT